MFKLNNEHILSVNDLSDNEVSLIFDRAKFFINNGFSGSNIRHNFDTPPVIALSFFEPSTRTKLSFDSAAQQLGCKTIGFDNPGNTSSAKGEQLDDTIRVIEKYSDLLVIRRKEHDTIESIIDASSKPVISAGVGAHEHPTQGLLDVFTISQYKNFDSIKHVVQYGDCVNSRTMFSQVRLLSRFIDKSKVVFSFVAPQSMQVPQWFMDELKQDGFNVNCVDVLDDVVADADVLHIIRPQKERWSDDPQDVYASVTEMTLNKMKSDALVMHALPRTGELSPNTDGDKRSVIFDQVQNGLYIRAVLIEALLS